MIENTLNQQSQNELELYNLYQLNDLLALMQRNLNLLQQNNQGNQIVVSFGNLFEFAASAYGDATLWTAIANANYSIQKDSNGFITPNINGITSLIIPPQPSTPSGGILNV